MTTSTTAPSDLNALPSGHYGLGGVFSSEWTKLSSVRSTVWALVVTAVTEVGIGALVTSAQAARFSTRSLSAQLTFDPSRSSLAGMLFAQLAIGVLGVLVVSAQYSTGTIRATSPRCPGARWSLSPRLLSLPWSPSSSVRSSPALDSASRCSVAMSSPC